MSTGLSPQNIEQIDSSTLGILWTDGVRHTYPVRDLRLACSCASCVHEWTGEQIVNEDLIPDFVHPQSIETVGLYGLRIGWSDGHNTGIYTYDHLRKLGEDWSSKEQSG